MSKLNEKGVAPLFIIGLMVVIATASVIVAKNYQPLTESYPSFDRFIYATPGARIKSKIIPSPSSTVVKAPSSPKASPTSQPSSPSTPKNETTSSSSTPTPKPSISSGNPFSSPSPSTVPYVKILSPNGGESYRVGDKVIIRWEAADIPWQTFNLTYKNCDSCAGTIANIDSSSARSYEWTVNVGNKGETFSISDFKIWIIGYSQNGYSGPTPQDQSDGTFTVSK